jgi:anti-sigma-K factor RskA
MNDKDIMLRVQAFVDGQLPEGEQAEIAALIARDADVAALVRELKQTRQALAGFEVEAQLPESREFYWSKIRREIERFPQEADARPERPSVAAVLLRWLVPATCVAALLAVGFLFLQDPWSSGDEVAWQAANDDVNAFTYRDYDEGMTVMWLSYPSDNTVANPEEAATIN